MTKMRLIADYACIRSVFDDSLLVCEHYQYIDVDDDRITVSQSCCFVIVCFVFSHKVVKVRRVSKKNVQNYFRHNFVKFPPTAKIVGTKMATRTNLCEVHSFPPSPNLRQCTTVLNADVPNSYVMLYIL